MACITMASGSRWGLRYSVRALDEIPERVIKSSDGAEFGSDGFSSDLSAADVPDTICEMRD